MNSNVIVTEAALNYSVTGRLNARAELAGDLKDKKHICSRVMKIKLVTSGRLLRTELNFMRISLKGVLTTNQILILFT